MSQGLFQEVMEARPPRPGREWWLLVDLAMAADDVTRQGECGIDYLTERSQASSDATFGWFASLHEQGLIRTVERDDRHVAYEILSLPSRTGRTAAEESRETALYRWFDGADRPLYIGIAGNLGSRTKSHVKGSSWMEFVARSAVERHPSRGAALAAEEAAIKAEHPIFNKQHNDTPEARERLYAYLEEAGRLELLASDMRAQIETERQIRERAERIPEITEDDIDPEDYWNELEADIIDSRWERAARDAWWRPWWNGHKGETNAMLDMSCPVRDPTTAIARWLSERRQEQREGCGHPQVWVTYCPAVDYPGDEWTWHGRWSAHADIAVIECGEPWEYWTDATAEAQEAFTSALLAAGKCLSIQAGKQAVLRGFDDKTDARMAGAVLQLLAWGHTEVALECAALLHEKAKTRSVDPTPDNPAA